MIALMIDQVFYSTVFQALNTNTNPTTSVREASPMSPVSHPSPQLLAQTNLLSAVCYSTETNGTINIYISKSQFVIIVNALYSVTMVSENLLDWLMLVEPAMLLFRLIELVVFNATFPLICCDLTVLTVLKFGGYM